MKHGKMILGELHADIPVIQGGMGVGISLSGLAVASLVGILLNAILPGNDYVFGANSQGDTSVNFKV